LVASVALVMNSYRMVLSFQGYPRNFPTRRSSSSSWFGIAKGLLVRWWAPPSSSAAADDTTSSSFDPISSGTATSTTAKVPAKFVNFPFQYHELVEMKVEKIISRGWGLGRVDIADRIVMTAASLSSDGAAAAHKRSRRAKPVSKTLDEMSESLLAPERDGEDGTGFLPPLQGGNDEPQKSWIVMVPNVIGGERVRVRIFRNHGRYSEADLVGIIEASPDRSVPPCPLAADCGGCQLQHLSIAAQRSWKRKIVMEALEQFRVTLQGDDDMVPTTVQPTLGTDEIYQYRSKLTPHYHMPSSARRGGDSKGKGSNVRQQREPSHDPQPSIQAIGFQRESSRQVVDVNYCHIATPAVNAAYRAERERLLHDDNNGLVSKRGATLLFRQANADDDEVTSNHKDYLTTKVNGLAFTYQAGNFFQNNYYVLPLMVEHVIEQATKVIVDDEGSGRVKSPPTHLVDCYCGSGLFAIATASYFDQVVGIEINDKAVAEAAANAQENGIANCSFRAASAEHIFAGLSFPVHRTVVVLDPPRKGCSDEFLAQLYAFGPQRIVYMACDPVTQARDAAGILGTGRYRLTFVQPFDLFPQTRHIESLMVFERKGSR
jgi:tRNA (uracil-5-)-methyltransferase